MASDGTKDTLHVVAHFHAKTDKAEELRTLLEGLVEPTRQEPGCIRYELHAHTNDPNQFTFIEEWTGPDRLAAHFETEHIKNAIPRLPDLLTQDLDVRTYTMIK